MSLPLVDLYAVLGVATTATPAEIRKAYLLQVREHSPGKDPQVFQRIQSAYDVLGQPESRRQYDEARAADPEARDLAEQGRGLLEQGDPAAVPTLKRALMKQPDAAWIRDLLTRSLLLAGRPDEAAKAAARVVATEPDNPVYLVRLGDVLRARDRDADALPYYRRAVSLERSNPRHVVKLAYLLDYLDREHAAIGLLEESIGHEGEASFDHFAYFQCLCTIYALRARSAELAATQRRLRSILPPGADERSHVAWFYYTNALRMARLGRLEAAVSSIEEAAWIDDGLPELRETGERLRRQRAALLELRRLAGDPTIHEALRTAVSCLGYWRALGEDEDLSQPFAQAAEALARRLATTASDLGKEVRALRARYPALARLVSGLLAEFEETAAHAPRLSLPPEG
jgi:tetratricopeptide (TPR) repeat protein